MHYSTIKPPCSNFRVITAISSGVRIFRSFTVHHKKTKYYDPPHDKTNKVSVRPVEMLMLLGIEITFQDRLSCFSCLDIPKGWGGGCFSMTMH